MAGDEQGEHCPHPARAGQHEVYVDGERAFCRACGARVVTMWVAPNAAAASAVERFTAHHRFRALESPKTFGDAWAASWWNGLLYSMVGGKTREEACERALAALGGPSDGG